MVSRKGQKSDKSQFGTEFVGIIVAIILYKNVSQIDSKIFDTQII